MSTFRRLNRWSGYMLLLVLTACTGAPNQVSVERVQGAISSHAMVSTAHPLATQVGVDILKRGGNAYDAAVAVQFALAVAYPRAGNIGGGGFLVFRTAEGEIGSLDFREKAPMNAFKDMYLNEDQQVVEGLSTNGHLASGVPGTVDGMVEIHSELGSLTFAELIQPAIDMAINGVVLTHREAEQLNELRDDFRAINNYETHVVRPSPWMPGDTLFQPELAQTLKRIQGSGRAGFYHSTTASLIVDEMQRGGGIITMEDLRDYRSVWREPVVGHYRSYRVISMGPPSSGGIALLQLLAGIAPHNIKQWGFNTSRTVHLMTELERRVYADRATYLGDPDFFDVPQDMLLDINYLNDRFGDINLNKATPSQKVKKGHVEIIESMETTHFSIIDSQGNAAAITTTLNGSYGNKVLVKGAGFFLNNEMDDFSIKPGFPNMFGLVGGVANAIAPGKRMLSSMTPTLVEKDGALLMVVGTPGGSTIITSVFQTILNVIDHGMTMQEAVNAKKFHHQWLPDEIDYEEEAFDQATMEKLMKMGHQLQLRESIGRMDAILRQDGQLEGAADYLRGDDTAIGY